LVGSEMGIRDGRTSVKSIGSMKEALHPEIDGREGMLNAMARRQGAIVSLTGPEKANGSDEVSGQRDRNNALIQQDLGNPTATRL
ncbi:hypothetical protein HX561_026145, partial [Escherichia coli]|nr:hypothetical protein [Escherichia coli]